MNLAQRQALPLDAKIVLTQQRIKEWYDHWDGQVYVAFSGGKDSTVLKHLVETTPGVHDVPSVFCNTGLEYPEVSAFARSQPNVTVVRPKMSFREVLTKYGYPVATKRQARFVRDIQRAHGDVTGATVNLRLTGYNRAGTYCPTMKLSKRWYPLIDAPFPVSEQCCDVIKKEPMKRFVKETGRVPIIGTMACESQMRAQEYQREGCNLFGAKAPKSIPMSFWTENDVLEYIVRYDLPYASVYGDIVKTDDGWATTGEHRTGCLFCMFGVHLEKTPNRFQRMAVTHPNQYDYCINELGCGAVLDFIGVSYTREDVA